MLKAEYLATVEAYKHTSSYASHQQYLHEWRTKQLIENRVLCDKGMTSIGTADEGFVHSRFSLLTTPSPSLF